MHIIKCRFCSETCVFDYLERTCAVCNGKGIVKIEYIPISDKELNLMSDSELLRYKSTTQ